MENLDKLKEAVEVAEAAYKSASAVFSQAKNAYAVAAAEHIGLRLGSIVRTKRAVGYGSYRRIVVSRFSVTRIAYQSFGQLPIALWGDTIRKDGSKGENHEIWKEWELERTEP